MVTAHSLVLGDSDHSTYCFIWNTLFLQRQKQFDRRGSSSISRRDLKNIWLECVGGGGCAVFASGSLNINSFIPWSSLLVAFMRYLRSCRKTGRLNHYRSYIVGNKKWEASIIIPDKVRHWYNISDCYDVIFHSFIVYYSWVVSLYLTVITVS